MSFSASLKTDLQARYPHRTSCWQLRTRRLELPTCPLVMGIINVTPDSFSDGGRSFAAGKAVENALRLVSEGADLLDIGGESTRPYSDPVDAEEELRRVIPVLRELCRQTTVPVSIDTSKAAVAEAALDCGVEIINDITGLEGDPEMIRVAKDSQAGVCAMHIQGTPQTMQDSPSYQDVVADIKTYLAARNDALQAAGLNPERICLDPGIGFGKTHQHNLTLMAACGQFHELGRPLLVGHSRKGFIAKVLGDKDSDRTAGTIGAACSLAGQGVQIIRVHDVEPVKQALRLFHATGGVTGQADQID